MNFFKPSQQLQSRRRIVLFARELENNPPLGDDVLQPLENVLLGFRHLLFQGRPVHGTLRSAYNAII